MLTVAARHNIYIETSVGVINLTWMEVKYGRVDSVNYITSLVQGLYYNLKLLNDLYTIYH